MENRTEQVVTRKKRNIKIISSLFIGLLIILTLFSNTLANWNLPKVITEKPKNSELKQTFTGNGELQPQEEAKLSNSSIEAKVKEVHVKAGDRVKKNQLLVTYDSKKSEQVILDEEATLQIQKLALNDAQANYNEAKKNQQENKSNDQPNNQQENKSNNQQDNQQENKSNSQPNGGISETSLQSLKTAVESKKIEISTQERKIKSLKEELEMSKKLIAPFDGVVTKINAKKDQLSTRDEGDVILSDESKGFKVEVQVPADLATHLKVGEKINLKGNAKSLEGELIEIKNIESNENQRPEEQGKQQDEQKGEPKDEQQFEQTSATPQPQKRILVKVQGEELKKGEQVEATLTKQLTKGVLIPNKVIKKEGQRTFVYTIEEKKGPLGNAFYIEESPITVGESNGQETVVLEGVYEKDQIVLQTSEPLKKGERVKIK
ncbi:MULTISPECIES: efflux RND transporter periplasmic adaptor subunit [Bacillus]|uniref:RND transporter n=1 Tax=Bacillus pseudomycoides TaxID=64104 RepID=A0ABD6TBI5_9BACI|nr:HlyD family efflux transporter periplasmic adaptor subunit [Bacillus pseudomycoides]KFN14094.1 hlyD secretion family protein [Bacillus pseudomycoides]MBD5800329.1 RND transporter [Bacillus pseudomycoides]MCR8855801.1 HlyD family efflux transporter periplasmic adaptor subunit [Bacillus pseudomycoides]MDR4187388.1 HlyD family efflux transporter periplasmic adaptor subunit [Bacillus pseudomycoides]MED0855783.1 HlyD family efflux transporter periplasmic adaptor subunit [Bacillus pseudomycoides]